MFDQAKKELRQIEKELDEIIRANEKKDNQFKKAVVDAKKEAARLDMELASAADDPKKIVELSEKRAICNARIKALFDTQGNQAAAPMLPEFDYLALVSRINDAAHAAERDALPVILDNHQKNLSISEALKELQNEANNLLYRLQHELYKDADMMTLTTSGTPTKLNVYRKTVKPDLWETIRLANICDTNERRYKYCFAMAEAYQANEQPPE